VKQGGDRENPVNKAVTSSLQNVILGDLGIEEQSELPWGELSGNFPNVLTYA
jgi:hypothetical protein